MYDNIPDVPFPELKRWFITRRVNKYLNRLTYDQYTIYKGDATIREFEKLLYRIIDLLGSGILKPDFRYYHLKFIEVRKKIRSIAKQENEGAKPVIYGEAITMLVEVLKEYREYISTYDFLTKYGAVAPFDI